MGGKAIKNVKTKRLGRREYEDIKSDVLSKLSYKFKKKAVPFSYSEKESFGDLDVVVANDKMGGMELRSFIETVFSPNEIVKNDDCWSFDYREFQVDLIKESEENFNTRVSYMSYNDLGNLVGGIAKGFGLKYGEKGLCYDVYFKGQKIKENIVISKDQRRIFWFLDLDHEKWERGFSSREEIFEFVYSSKYFNVDHYRMENLNKINRDRNQKRDTYMAFLEWLNEINSPKRYPFKENKISYVDQIDAFFPEVNLVEEIRKAEFEHTKELYIKSKISVDKVIHRFNYPPNQAQTIIDKFKHFFTSKEVFENFVLNSTEEEILKKIESLVIRNEGFDPKSDIPQPVKF